MASAHAAIAWCLEVHDLVLSKCVRGDPRDWEYASEALKAGIVHSDTLLARVADLPVAPEVCEHIELMLRGLITSLA